MASGQPSTDSNGAGDQEAPGLRLPVRGAQRTADAGTQSHPSLSGDLEVRTPTSPRHQRPGITFPPKGCRTQGTRFTGTRADDGRAPGTAAADGHRWLWRRARSRTTFQRQGGDLSGREWMHPAQRRSPEDSTVTMGRKRRGDLTSTHTLRHDLGHDGSKKRSTGQKFLKKSP